MASSSSGGPAQSHGPVAPPASIKLLAGPAAIGLDRIGDVSIATHLWTREQVQLDPMFEWGLEHEKEDSMFFKVASDGECTFMGVQDVFSKLVYMEATGDLFIKDTSERLT